MHRKACLVTVISIFLVSCAARRPVQFESVPARPYYILRNPARVETPYPEVLAQHGDPVQGWVDLTRSMAIKIEKLIFADPGAAQNIANFVGLESALFDVSDTGRLTNMRVQELANRPAQESPISSLLGTRFQKRRFHRLYFQVLLDRRSGESAAVLLGADSREALRRQDLQLKANARAVLSDGEANSVIFPPNVTVSLQFEIIVNGNQYLYLGVLPSRTSSVSGPRSQCSGDMAAGTCQSILMPKTPTRCASRCCRVIGSSGELGIRNLPKRRDLLRRY